MFEVMAALLQTLLITRTSGVANISCDFVCSPLGVFFHLIYCRWYSYFVSGVFSFFFLSVMCLAFWISFLVCRFLYRSSFYSSISFFFFLLISDISIFFILSLVSVLYLMYLPLIAYLLCGFFRYLFSGVSIFISYLWCVYFYILSLMCLCSPSYHKALLCNVPLFEKGQGVIW